MQKTLNGLQKEILVDNHYKTIPGPVKSKCPSSWVHMTKLCCLTVYLRRIVWIDKLEHLSNTFKNNYEKSQRPFVLSCWCLPSSHIRNSICLIVKYYVSTQRCLNKALELRVKIYQIGRCKKYYTSENIKMVKFNKIGPQTKNYAEEIRQ